MMRSVPLVYRLLLLGLLPCIAWIFYVRGQSYDPALIDFRTAAGPATTPMAGSALPQSVDRAAPAPAVREIAGFRQVGEGHRYTKDNLYEHVDGHAEYFISAGFMGLTVTEYAAAGSVAKQADIQVEVYDMGKGIQAFGVLSDESGENPQAVSAGAMGFRTSGGVNFIKGRYYVKISTFNAKVPVGKFARAFSDTLPSGQDSFNKVFAMFPDMGKVRKTRYVKDGYRGLDFLHNVTEREYSTGGKKITVALMTGSLPEMKALLSSFMDYFRKSGVRYEKIERGGSEVYKVLDKYEGNWFLISAGNSIFGVFGTDDEDILKYFTKRTG
ncbi:MAG: hypothetical protein HQL09_03440 [Nitrospirae bacterium]|nr:hypothetical protein [Nitrospirota bacterium]